MTIGGLNPPFGYLRLYESWPKVLVEYLEKGRGLLWFLRLAVLFE